MKNLILAIFLFVGLGASAQTYNKLYTGAAGDTLVQSATLYKVIPIKDGDLQTLSVQVFSDSVSGTPGATVTLYKSLDGVNWITTGQSATYVTGVDTTFILTDTTFYGEYAKVELVGNGTTQKALITATLKSWNKN